MNFGRLLPVVALMMAGVVDVRAADEVKIQALLADVKAGPRIYSTSGALEFASRSRGYASQPPMPQQIEAANKALRAVMALGAMGSNARSAVSTLIDIYTTAAHGVTVYETYGPGEGSIEDWVMTKVMGEKNKFMFSSPFLSYEDLSRCDRFLDVKHEYATSGSGYGSNVTVHVLFTFHAAACALSQITGADFGTDVEKWRMWGQASGAATSSVQVVPDVALQPAPVAQNAVRPADVALGGTYRFTLSTGDVFTARVEGRTDTSVIAETDQGAAYTFRIPLIRECILVSPPKAAAAAAGPVGPEELTYEQLKSRSPKGVVLIITMKSGKAFKGTFSAIEEESVKLDVDGSIIPIHKDVIASIVTVVPEAAKKEEPKKVVKKEGPFDTLVVRNPKTDSWGKRMASFVYVGTIVSDYGDKVTLEREDGATVEVKREEIERFIKHSSQADATIDAIAQYARPLICPDGMRLVDLPPTVPGKPFLKVCIDRYEYPNEQGMPPKGNVSFAEAQKLCADKGKRLCTTEEWQWACSGIEGHTYPYGAVFDENTCNSSTKGLSGAGSRTNCVSKFGVHDMSGNVFEWVTDARGRPMMMGGPVSKCQTVSPGLDGSAKPLSGLRCCKSN